MILVSAGYDIETFSHGSPDRKVFLLAKCRHHDEGAVRKREAFVRICMVSDQGPVERFSVLSQSLRTLHRDANELHN